MKKSTFTESLLMLVVIFACSLMGVDVSMAAAGTPLGATGNGTAVGTTGVAGVGVHLTGEDAVSSVEQARLESPDLLISELDRVVTKILPYKTPLDQIFRYAQQRSAKSMKVEWISVDTKPFTTNLTNAYTINGTPTTANSVYIDLTVDDASVFAVTSTILVPSVMGYNEAGTTRSTDTPLMLYVKAKSGSVITVMAVNGAAIANSNLKSVPSIAADASLLRQGRAAYEKDVQTEASGTYPTKENNYMQAFKCQVEESFWYKQSDKVIDWTMQDQKEMAILEWKMEIEASYLSGVKGITLDNSTGKGEVYTCNGILRYIKKKYEYAATGWTKDDFVDLTQAAFTGNAGSPQRVLLAGSDLLADISKVDLTLQKDMTQGQEVLWGIEFKYIRTNFGKILILHHELLDIMEMSEMGILIDPNQFIKFTFEAENSRKIDNRTTGLSNTEAEVTTEVSCPALKYPQAHLVISKKSA